MRVSTNFAPPLSAVLFGLLLVSRVALAATADCPVEPASNVPLADGEVLAGTNCTLNTAGDVDSFVFKGTSGDTYQLAVAINGAIGGGPNVCLTLYNPSLSKIYGPQCSNVNVGQNSVVTDQKLTATGSYTIDITEPYTGMVNYAVSLERLYPFPPNAQQVGLAKVVAGDIAELTDSNAFTFEAVTTGEYGVSATLPSGAPLNRNLCMTVYLPDGTSPPNGSGCTNINVGNYSVIIDFTPTQDGTSMAFLYVEGNDGTDTYSLEVSCLAGKCIQPPYCGLTDTLSYTSGTLTMNFTVENSYATTWNAWLIYQNATPVPLFSVSQAITPSPTPYPKTATLGTEGNVGVLSTLTTPTNGITCSSWAQIQTGAP